MRPKKAALAARDVALLAMLAALLVVGKEALAFLPNIEIVSMLILLYTLEFGRRTLIAIAVFVVAEGLLYGFGTWWWSYTYIWAALYVAVRLLRRNESALVWALVLALFGLLFGTLSGLVYLLLSGPVFAAGWIIQGIPFDAVHAVGNFVTGMLLYNPLRHVLHRGAALFQRE